MQIEERSPICLVRPPAVETFRFATTSISLPLGLASIAATLGARLRPGWMSRSEEARMFASWDEIYRSVRDRHIAEGLAERSPSDSRALHDANVIPLLRRSHGRRHVVSA